MRVRADLLAASAAVAPLPAAKPGTAASVAAMPSAEAAAAPAARAAPVAAAAAAVRLQTRLQLTPAKTSRWVAAGSCNPFFIVYLVLFYCKFSDTAYWIIISSTTQFRISIGLGYLFFSFNAVYGGRCCGRHYCLYKGAAVCRHQ
jgi:hypothetical protein